MPLTINVPITLDDATLAALRAALGATGPVVTPPPVVLPEPKRTLHFGYFGAPTDAENADHTTFTFAPGWDLNAGFPLTRPTVLFAAWGQPMDEMLGKVKAQGGLHHIIAMYPQDEPAENGLNEAQTVAKFESARTAARAVGLNPPPPIMVCYGRKGTPGIANADIIGLDDYGQGPIKLPLSRPDQRLFYIPGGCNPWREDPVAFAEAALADPAAWGVVSFIWIDQWGGTQHLGVRSNGMADRHRQAFVKLGGMLPAPVVAPKPTEPFDEAYYLQANPDVAAAVQAGMFINGWHHYDTNGRAEGRPAVRPAVVTPPPEPPPATQWEPRAVYPSPAALKADLKGKAFSQCVLLDNAEVQSGFGPAYNYYQWADGSVRTTQPPVAPRKSGDALLSSYGKITSLLEDAAAVGWQFALEVDGKIVKQGFEPDNRADMVYVTRGGKVVKQ